MKICPHCGIEIIGTGYPVDIGGGFSHAFCSEACADNWSDNEDD